MTTTRVLLSLCIIALAAATQRALAAPPRITPGDPASLQRGIDAAVQAGDGKLVVPPGVYRVDGTIRLKVVKDLEIDATGVTLLRVDNDKRGIVLDRCENVTIRGLTMRCETVPFTQGRIEQIDPDKRWIDLRVDAGYPAEYLKRRTTGYVFDRGTRQWKAGTYDYGINGAEQRDGVLRLTLDGKLGGDVEVGDLMAFRGPGEQDILVAGCENVTLDGLTLYGGSGFCVHEDGGEGGSRYTYTLTYPPKPNGATAAPLIASNADAFHSGGARKGPTLEGCKFEGMCDDGIPIHGYYGLVVERQDDGRTLVMAGRNFFQPGDPIRVLDKTGALVGEAKVVSGEPAPDDFEPHNPPQDKHFELDGHFYQLTLDKPVPAEPGFRASTPNANGSGFVIRNNTIKNHRARGILVKADDGLIEGNEVDGSTIAGLVIAPEYYWNEAGYSRNVVVRNNVFRHCGYATAGPWTGQAGAATVSGEGDQANGTAFGHQNILFQNNAFEDNDGVNLLVDGAQDVRIVGNTFLRPMQAQSRRGADAGVDPSALIYLKNCRDVTLENNAVRRPGDGEMTLVQLGPAASNVSGVNDGVHAENEAAAGAFRYKNPLPFSYEADGETRTEIRDPCVVREGDTYYLVFTMWPFANREEDRLNLPDQGGSPGIRIFSSKDMKSWTPGKWLVKSSDLPESSPYKNRFWAPEIHKIGGKFYLIFTADNWIKPDYNPAGNWGTAGYAFVGVADQIDGPYEHVTYLDGGACDTSLFGDADGKTYAVIPRYNIDVQEIDLTKLDQGKVTLVGEPKMVVKAENDDIGIAAKPDYLEGPWMTRVGGRYLLFYAEIYRDEARPDWLGYWTNVAYADAPTGPWKKDPRGRLFLGGHLAVFDGPGGERWFSYRGESGGGAAGRLCVDPFWLDAAGRVGTPAPTTRPRAVEARLRRGEAR